MTHMTRARAAAENITVAAVPLKQWKERKPRIYKTAAERAAAKRKLEPEPDPESAPAAQAPKRRRKSQPRQSPAA